MLFSRLQQALGWQPASVDAVRDGRIRVVMMGNRWRSQHARRPPPAQQVRLPPQLGWLCLGSASAGEARAGRRRTASPRVAAALVVGDAVY